MDRVQDSGPDWSGDICYPATLNDLDPAAIAKARELFKDRRPGIADEADKWDAITFFNKARILKNGRITNTAILLLGKEESESFLSPALGKISWILKDRTGLEKDYQLPDILTSQQKENKIRNLLQEMSKKDRSIKPQGGPGWHSKWTLDGE